MAKIVFIHGINTDGDDDIFEMADLLKSNYADLDIYRFRYGPIGVNKARDLKFLQETSIRLIDEIGDGAILIAHSNGCRIAIEAMRLGMDAKLTILFAPAVEEWLALPGKGRGCKSMIVVHNPRDRAILAGEHLWYHPFGAMGRDGYQGPHDERIKNFEALPLNTPGKFKHSGYFTGDDLPIWTSHVKIWIDQSDFSL